MSVLKLELKEPLAVLVYVQHVQSFNVLGGKGGWGRGALGAGVGGWGVHGHGR